MNKSKEFNEGWWNCLFSFAQELVGMNRCITEQIVQSVIIAAGVSDDELNEVLDNAQSLGMPEEVYELLEDLL